MPKDTPETKELKRQIRTLLKAEGTGLRLIRLDEQPRHDTEVDEPVLAPWEFADPEGCYATGGNGLRDPDRGARLRQALGHVAAGASRGLR